MAPMLVPCIFTVVSRGRICSAAEKSPKPTTEASSGMRRPRARSSEITVTASPSWAQK